MGMVRGAALSARPVCRSLLLRHACLSPGVRLCKCLPGGGWADKRSGVRLCVAVHGGRVQPRMLLTK